MTTTWYGYPLSGLTCRGISDEGIVGIGYVLYEGKYGNKEKFGDEQLIRPLTPGEVERLRRELDQLKTEVAGGVLDVICDVLPQMPATYAAAYAWVPPSRRPGWPPPDTVAIG